MDADGDGVSDDQENSPDVPESEIKVCNVKDIQQSNVISVGKDDNEIKSSEVSVNSNLSLGAEANALSSEAALKLKLPPEKIATESVKDGEKRSDSPMSDASVNKSKTKVKTKTYYCHVCDFDLNSKAAYMTHIEGRKHQKKLETTRFPRSFQRRAKKIEKLQFRKIKAGCHITRLPKPSLPPHMQEEIQNMKEPRLGLQFISEIWMIGKSEDVYYCSLCAVTCSPNAIMDHIVGVRHRLTYMGLHDLSNYEEVKALRLKKSELTARLHSYAIDLQKRDGPGKVQVEIEVDDKFRM